MKESITRRRQAPSIATVGSTCDLNLKIPGEDFLLWGGNVKPLSLSLSLWLSFHLTITVPTVICHFLSLDEERNNYLCVKHWN